MSRYDDFIKGSYSEFGAKKAYDRPGEYLQLITRVEHKPKAVGAPGAHQFTIIFHKTVLAAEEGSEAPVGYECCDVIPNTNQYFAARTVGALGNILGEEATGEHLEAAVGNEQLVSGLVVPVTVEEIDRSDQGKNNLTQVVYGEALPWSVVKELVDPEVFVKYIGEAPSED